MDSGCASDDSALWVDAVLLKGGNYHMKVHKAHHAKQCLCTRTSKR